MPRPAKSFTFRVTRVSSCSVLWVPGQDASARKGGWCPEESPRSRQIHRPRRRRIAGEHPINLFVGEQAADIGESVDQCLAGAERWQGGFGLAGARLPNHDLLHVVSERNPLGLGLRQEA